MYCYLSVSSPHTIHYSEIIFQVNGAYAKFHNTVILETIHLAAIVMPDLDFAAKTDDLSMIKTEVTFRWIGQFHSLVVH